MNKRINTPYNTMNENVFTYNFSLRLCAFA